MLFLHHCPSARRFFFFVTPPPALLPRKMGRGKMLNAAEKAVVRTLRAKDMGYKEIARCLGKSATAVGNVIRNAGIAKTLGRPKKVNAQKEPTARPRTWAPSHLDPIFVCLRFVFIAEVTKRSGDAFAAHIERLQRRADVRCETAPYLLLPPTIPRDLAPNYGPLKTINVKVVTMVRRREGLLYSAETQECKQPSL